MDYNQPIVFGDTVVVIEKAPNPPNTTPAQAPSANPPQQPQLSSAKILQQQQPAPKLPAPIEKPTTKRVQVEPTNPWATLKQPQAPLSLSETPELIQNYAANRSIVKPLQPQQTSSVSSVQTQPSHIPNRSAKPAPQQSEKQTAQSLVDQEQYMRTLAAERKAKRQEMIEREERQRQEAAKRKLEEIERKIQEKKKVQEPQVPKDSVERRIAQAAPQQRVQVLSPPDRDIAADSNETTQQASLAVGPGSKATTSAAQTEKDNESKKSAAGSVSAWKKLPAVDGIFVGSDHQPSSTGSAANVASKSVHKLLPPNLYPGSKKCFGESSRPRIWLSEVPAVEYARDQAELQKAHARALALSSQPGSDMSQEDEKKAEDRRARREMREKEREVRAAAKAARKLAKKANGAASKGNDLDPTDTSSKGEKQAEACETNGAATEDSTVVKTTHPSSSVVVDDPEAQFKPEELTEFVEVKSKKDKQAEKKLQKRAEVERLAKEAKEVLKREKRAVASTTFQAVKPNASQPVVSTASPAPSVPPKPVVKVTEAPKVSAWNNPQQTAQVLNISVPTPVLTPAQRKEEKRKERAERKKREREERKAAKQQARERANSSSNLGKRDLVTKLEPTKLEPTSEQQPGQFSIPPVATQLTFSLTSAPAATISTEPSDVASSEGADTSKPNFDTSSSVLVQPAQSTSQLSLSTSWNDSLFSFAESNFSAPFSDMSVTATNTTPSTSSTTSKRTLLSDSLPYKEFVPQSERVSKLDSNTQAQISHNPMSTAFSGGWQDSSSSSSVSNPYSFQGPLIMGYNNPFSVSQGSQHQNIFSPPAANTTQSGNWSSESVQSQSRSLQSGQASFQSRFDRDHSAPSKAVSGSSGSSLISVSVVRPFQPNEDRLGNSSSHFSSNWLGFQNNFDSYSDSFSAESNTAPTANPSISSNLGHSSFMSIAETSTFRAEAKPFKPQQPQTIHISQADLASSIQSTSSAAATLADSSQDTLHTLNAGSKFTTTTLSTAGSTTVSTPSKNFVNKGDSGRPPNNRGRMRGRGGRGRGGKSDKSAETGQRSVPKGHKHIPQGPETDSNHRKSRGGAVRGRGGGGKGKGKGGSHRPASAPSAP